MLTLRFCVLALVCLFFTPGCKPQTDNIDKKPTAQKTIRVTDFAGNTLILNSPAKRIIALAPHIAENVFTAGAGEQLVGVVTYSNFPESVKDLPEVGSYAKINFEKILELNPDLVIAWESGNSDSSVARIRELGYPVYLDQPDTLKDLAKSVRDIGILSGNLDYAESVTHDYLKALTLIEKQNKTYNQRRN